MRDYLNLVRFPNLIFITILLWVMQHWVANPIVHFAGGYNTLPEWVLWAIIVATVAIAAGGYVINDYFDVKIDRINRPDKLIVTRSITKERAMLLFQILTAAGIIIAMVVSWWLKSMRLAMIFILVPGLLWFYSSSYKRQFLVGNLIIALIAGITPILVAFANVAYLEKADASLLSMTPVAYWLFVWLAGFGLFAFLCTLIREIVKDLQDQMGDRELECHSLPIRLGETKTKVIVILLIVMTAALLCYVNFAIIPFPVGWHSLSTRYLVYGLLIPLACEMVLLLTAKIPTDYYQAQQLMKFIMFIGILYSYVINQQIPALAATF